MCSMFYISTESLIKLFDKQTKDKCRHKSTCSVFAPDVAMIEFYLNVKFHHTSSNGSLYINPLPTVERTRKRGILNPSDVCDVTWCDITP